MWPRFVAGAHMAHSAGVVASEEVPTKTCDERSRIHTRKSTERKLPPRARWIGRSLRAVRSTEQEAGDFVPGQKFFDHFALTIPDDSDLFHPDGQVRDEDYEFTSFLSSKMYGAGVTCSNCHKPHSATLRAEGNGLCAQCHLPAKFDVPEHHHHQASSAGANRNAATRMGLGNCIVGTFCSLAVKPLSTAPLEPPTQKF